MIEAKVVGIPDLREALRGIVPKLRQRALRNALAAGAREVRKAMRAATPVISPAALPVRLGYRKPGTVRKVISVRASKEARAAGNVGVFVNVRPAKGARFKTQRLAFGLKVRRQVRASQRGAKSPNDPFYWRFLAFGTKHMRPFPILDRGIGQLPTALRTFVAKIVPAIEKLNSPKAPAP